ncbi:MAG: hypothetical protein AAFU60_15900, partial [Bacteroidota bacterium]
ENLRSKALSLELNDTTIVGERDYIGDLTRHKERVTKKKVLVDELINSATKLPRHKSIEKLEDYLNEISESPDIRRMHLGVVSFPAQRNFEILDKRTSQQLENKKDARKLGKAYALLQKAKRQSGASDLNVPIIRRDSLRALRNLITESEEFLNDYEIYFSAEIESKRVAAAQAKIRSAERYFRGFWLELITEISWEDNPLEYQAFKDAVISFETIGVPEKAFTRSFGEVATQFAGKIGNNLTFRTGRSDILPEAEMRLKRWLRSQLSNKIEKRRSFGSTSILVNLKVSGYADQQPWRGQNSESGRKRLNFALSQRRANTIKRIFEEELTQIAKIYPEVTWDVYAEGYGEDLPPGVEPDDLRINNPDRRVCIFDGTIENKKSE